MNNTLTLTPREQVEAVLAPAQETSRINAKHQYTVVINGVWTEVPAVTAVLGALAKPALITWAGKVQRADDFDAAWQLFSEERRFFTREAMESALLRITGKPYACNKRRDKAGEVGTEVHKLVEHLALRSMGLDVPEPTVSDKAHFVYAGFEEWWASNHVVPLAAEKRVYSTAGLPFAGTFDLWALVDGRHTILDWKTGHVGLEAMLQSAAYRMAAVELGLPQADGLIVQIPKDGGEIKPIPVTLDVERLYEAFKALRTVHELMKEAA